MGEQLTESDVKKIKEEIEYRKIVVRKKELEAVKEARAQGDLSENFEYKAAKQDKNRNESRIRYLERMLKTANIVSDDSKEDEIGINNTVDLYFEDDEEVETYRIVTSVRGNSLAGLISIESPLGKAVLGHKVGDRVKIPAGDDGYYVVVKISKSEKIFLRILQREFTYAIMPVGRKEIRRSFIVTNPRKSRTLSGVFNSIPAWENQDHRYQRR